MAGRFASRFWDERIAALADRQYGVVSRAQLRALGLGRGAIDHRVERRRLHVVHAGVYAVGRRRLTRSGVWMAAVLACGERAVLSHRSAGMLWGIVRREPKRTEVSAPRRAARPGIRVHVTALAEDERTAVEGLPVTTAARTLLDLAASLNGHELARALEQAEKLELGDAVPLAALLERHRGRRGAARLAALVASEERPAGLSRSELEDDFLVLVDQLGLPPPRKNHWVVLGPDYGVEVDCAWPKLKLAVELDSWRHHATKAAFVRDRRRDRRLRLAGWEPLRVTGSDLTAGRERLAEELLGLTSARRATP